VVAQHASEFGIIWIVAAAISGILIPSVFALGTRQYVVMLGESFGLQDTYANKLGQPLRTMVSPIKLRPVTWLMSYPIDGTEKEKENAQLFPPDERAQIAYWRELLRKPFHRYPTPMMRPWRTPNDYVFISYAWRDDPGSEVSTQIAEACRVAGIKYFLDKRNRANGRDSFRRSLASCLGKSTHFFLVVSPNITRGHVVIREIEMAMTRWAFEITPTIICVVDPCLAAEFRRDARLPLALRFLLTFCPQMTAAEAAEPALVRYIVELTRREGKLHDWLPLLSPGTTVGQAMRMAGIADEPLAADTEK